jgi:polyhydroxyalkanoate synthesis repressor PhaR
MTSSRVIKKYPNRRLYDTRTSRYITLEGLKFLIVDGEAVQVVDAKSGADISREVLLQLVAEQESMGRPILTEKLLVGLIRFYDHPLQKTASRYLELALSQLREHQARLGALLRNPLESKAAAAAQWTRDISRMHAEWLQLLQDTFQESIGALRRGDNDT